MFFNIVQISDLHLSAHKNAQNFFSVVMDKRHFDALKGIVLKNVETTLFYPTTYNQDILISLTRSLANDVNDVDLILLNGDTSTTGTMEDLNVAFKFLNEQPISANSIYSQDKKPALKAAGVKYFLIPGNHDTYQHNVFGIPMQGSRKFDKIFNKYWKGGNGVRVDSTVLQKQEVKLALIGVDFSLEKKDSTNILNAGNGKVYTPILDNLKKVTMFHQNQGCVILWAVHYSPLETDTFLKIINSNDLMALSKEMGVKYILCGHTHKYKIYRGNTNIIVADSATSFGDKNGFNKLEFTVKNHAVSSCNVKRYLYNSEVGANGGKFNLESTEFI